MLTGGAAIRMSWDLRLEKGSTTLLRAANQLSVLIVCENQALTDHLTHGLSTVAPEGAGNPAIDIAEPNCPNVDVLLIEVGGNAGLDIFRDYRDHYPLSALVVYAREGDAELAEVATQHGADDIVFQSEATPTVLRRVVRYAAERTRLTRELITAREREAQLTTHDSVTGLANRSLLFTCMGQAIAFAQRRRTGLAVAALDIRHLQQINERFGYRAGDTVLSIVAERIVDALRTSDMVGRLGGDEYIVLLRDISSPADAGKAMETIFREVTRPLYLAGQKLSVEARAGVAFCPNDGEDPQSLVRLAHEALLAAKANGSGYRYAQTQGFASTG